MNCTTLSREENAAKNYNQLWTLLGDALNTLKKGELNEGLAQLDEILLCGSSDFNLLAEVYKWYGRASRKVGLFDTAYKYFSYEFQMHRFTKNVKEASDTNRRIVELCLKIGKPLKAKRSVLELVEFATDNNNMEIAIDGLLILAGAILEHINDIEGQAELLSDAISSISESKKIMNECGSVMRSGEVKMIEAKYMAVCGNYEEAINLYEECISYFETTDDYNKIHICHFEMARRCGGTSRIFVAHQLRSALLYAELCDDKRTIISYSIEMAKCMQHFRKYKEALIYSSKALDLSKHVGSYSLDLASMLAVSRSMIGLRKIEKAARVIVDASILALTTNDEKNVREFYNIIDEVMMEIKHHNEGEVEIVIESTEEEVRTALKLDHTTTLETWKITIRDIIEARRKASEPPVVEKDDGDENEELDLFELISKLNERMEEQRSEMPKSDLFARPVQPTSSQSSTKSKSHRLLPGLRANIAKLSEMKIDKKLLQRLMKKKNKSKVSLNSDSHDVALDISSDIDNSTICSASDIASFDSTSLNKENLNYSKGESNLSAENN